MKKNLFLLSVVLAFIFTGCSNLVNDLSKMKGGVKYTVNHLLQNVDAVTEDDYTLDKSEDLYGKPGEMTNALMRSYKGFSLAKNFEIQQKLISEEEPVVVDIKYDRNEYTIQFDPNGGLWNYDQVKESPTVEKLNSNIKLTGRYGAVVKENENYPEFEKLKKKGCVFIGWKKEGSDKVIPAEEIESKLPQIFDVQESDVIYVAQWEINGSKYIVRHMTEDLDGINYSVFKDQEMAGEAEELTEAAPIEIDGFTKPEESSVVQKEISSDKDNVTIIEIKYARKSYNVVLDANGGYWNYLENKANSGITLAGDNRSISVKYGAEFRLNSSVPSGLGKKSMKLAGWFKDGDTTVCIATEDGIVAQMPSKDIEFKASWVENYVEYKVEYWLENTNDNLTSVDLKRTKTLSGLAETQTQVSLTTGENLYVLDDIEGFSKPSSVSNAEIKADGTTVIKVEYKRLRYTVSFNTDGGAWNYEANKASPETVKADTNTKYIEVKFGASVTYPDFTGLGKKGSELVGWKIEETNTVISTLPAIFNGTSNINYVAVWGEKTASYKVEYKLQNIAGTEFVLIDNETKILNGPAETPTKVSLTTVDGYYVIKDFPGFTKPEKVDNKEINPDGSTVITLNYTRNTYEVKFDLDEGMWNYSAYNADKAGVTPDSRAKVINVKYEDTIPYPSFADVGKRTYELKGWITDSENIVSSDSLPLTQTATKNITYTASWNKLNNISYKVEHWFENLDSDNDAIEANYTVDSKYTQNLKGVAEMLTEAQAITVPGFTSKEITQEEINRNGSTVVKIFYKRNIVNISFDLNGGTWDYDVTTKTGTNKEIKLVSGKYGTNVNYDSIPFASKGRKSCDFLGWIKTGVASAVNESNLITTFPVEDVKYTASWQFNGNIKYTVKHWFEKTTSTNAANLTTANYEQISEYPNETLLGVEDEDTDAQAKVVPGFTARTYSQVNINGDGSSVVNIYYSRNEAKITLKVNGGKWSDNTTANKTITGVYGKTVTTIIPEPVRSGWAFGGWNEYQGTVEKVFADGEVIYTAYWIPSVTVQPSFNGDISMTSTTNSTTTTCTVTLPSGYTAQDCHFRWYVDGVFVSDESNLVRTKTQLGTGIHTITVKVTIDGVTYSKQNTVKVSL